MQISKLKSKNQNFPKTKNGFTLLEMLVVTALAAMILSFVFVSVRSAKQKSRDSRREADIKQLQSILSIYVTNRGFYPACPAEVVINGASDCLSSVLILSDASQANKISTDPLGASAGACGAVDSYVYCYQSTNNATSYTIRYALETNSISGKSAGWQSATP